MLHSPSLHHSFDIDLAAECGIEEAILIHHFQHWIRHNRAMERNFFDGRTWMYQTREEISNHFPYLSVDQVKRTIDSLIKKNILIKGNFNKTPFDRTVWYAFNDEQRFINSNTSYVGRNRPIEKQLSPNPKMDIAQPIPDTIPDTETEEEPRPSACLPQEAGDVTSALLESIKKTKADIKVPNLPSWQKEIERMLRIDKRSIEISYKIIEWLPTSPFWSKTILSADNFREHFDRLEIDMNKSPRQAVSKDSILLKKLEEYVSKNPNRKIIVGSDYVEFPEIRDAYFRVGDIAFEEKVLNSMRKCGIPIGK